MDKLTEQKRQGYTECVLKIQHWKKFKSDYDVLEQRLRTLPDKISYDIMVPFGPHAFMPGSLVHTNNITVLLGENWFTDMSAKQAAEFVQRRIEQCDKMLEDLERERTQFQNWLTVSMGVSEEQPKEITEICNEEELQLWREQHRKNVQHHKKMEAKERAAAKNLNQIQSQEISNVKTEEDVFGMLNDLEMMEEQDEINNSDSETEEELSDESDDDLESKESRMDTRMSDAQQVSDAHHKKSSQIDTDHNCEKQDKHVRWIDLSEAKSKCITITHSKSPPIHGHMKKKTKRKRRNSSTSDFDEEESEDKNGSVINSPSDIYKCFSLQQYKPKSILKSSSTEMTVLPDELQNLRINDNDDWLSQKTAEECETFNDNYSIKKVNQNIAFTGEVKEHFQTTPQDQISPPQGPKSLFKSSRQRAKV